MHFLPSSRLNCLCAYTQSMLTLPVRLLIEKYIHFPSSEVVPLVLEITYRN